MLLLLRVVGLIRGSKLSLLVQVLGIGGLLSRVELRGRLTRVLSGLGWQHAEDVLTGRLSRLTLALLLLLGIHHSCIIIHVLLLLLLLIRVLLLYLLLLLLLLILLAGCSLLLLLLLSGSRLTSCVRELGASFLILNGHLLLSLRLVFVIIIISSCGSICSSSCSLKLTSEGRKTLKSIPNPIEAIFFSLWRLDNAKTGYETTELLWCNSRGLRLELLTTSGLTKT